MRLRLSALSIVVTAVAASAVAAYGQTAAPAKKSNHNTYGSPLDTLMSSHLWTDVPSAQEFVKDSRPDPKSLRYEPLTGIDPTRPKPRDAANVQALQAELEHDRVGNNRKAPAGARSAKMQAAPRQGKTKTVE